MRYLKLILAILLGITLLFSTVFYNHSSVITSLVNNYLQQHQSSLTCIDLSLDESGNVVISRLCIDSPYAEVELIDSIIEWRFEPGYLQVENIIDAVSSISISSAHIRAKEGPSPLINTVNTASTLRDFPTLIRQVLHEVSALSVPIELEVKSFFYQPFIERDDKENNSYQGTFLATEQGLGLSVAGSKEESVFKLDITKKGQGLNANFNTELTRLRAFLFAHKAALPATVVRAFANKNSGVWSIAGDFESHIDWYEQRLAMSNKFTNFSLEKGVNKLDAKLAWQATLEKETLKIDFSQGNNIQVDFDQPELIKLLVEKGAGSQMSAFLTNNAINNFNVESLGSITVDFSKQTIDSDGIYLTSKNLNKPVTLSLDNIALSYRDSSAISVDLQRVDFSFVGPIKLAKLNSFTQHPITFNVVGGIEQQHYCWQLKLTPNSSIELSQLALPVSKEKTPAKANNPKEQASLKKLLSYWQGNVTIPKSNNGDIDASTTDMSFDLQINNQISQLNLPKVAKINALNLITKLKGRFFDIDINTHVIADKLAIASAKFTGDIFQPHVDIFAKDVLITDLLALNIALPIELKLIDGKLTYRLTGDIKKIDDLMTNPINLDLAINNVIGEVDGTWLQDLNWQQKFIAQNGEVTSVSDAHHNNLSIAKIETATPIMHLSTKTAINFTDNVLTAQVNNTRGYLLGGRFDVTQAQWPFSKDQPFEVVLTEIDLEKLLELDQKQGVVVTGRVSGALPIFYDGEHFLIKEGGIHNVGDGLIQVYNNPGVEELKRSSTELKLAFDALDNLHYHHLSSDVSMADDGYMLLVTAIKGRNPDLDNDVNLNLNLSYDLLGLLESLKITEHFESKVIKGLQR
ncbi:MAG: hypothetical protein GY928_20845 [Colwellia sp.]|nr:hypothetical protein [Colwellia sp.]